MSATLTKKGNSTHGYGESREGFAIGWSYAIYGLTPQNDAEPDILDGYRAGREHFRGRIRPNDRYIRKWLHVQHNAWRRGRVFDQQVTPEYIQTITPTRCPVTRELLTFATGTDTDWSVDRIVNNGGYAPGNLVVMSTRANLAKDSLDYGAILGRLSSAEERGKLSVIEWARLASIVGMVVDEESILPMLVVPPTKMMVTNRYTMLQLATMHSAISYENCRLTAGIRQVCAGKKAKRALDAYLDLANYKLTRQSSAANMEEWYLRYGDAWEDGALLKAFKGWIKEMTATGVNACLNAAAKHVGIRPVAQSTRNAWSEETGGYLAERMSANSFY